MRLFKCTKDALGSYVARNISLGVLQAGPIPEHVAFIMDGNRRYSRTNGVPVAKGHYKGSQVTTNILELCCDLGVKCVTIYAFSLENFHRTTEEVDQLMKLLQYQVIECIRPGGLAERYECTFKMLGRTDKLNETTKEIIEKAKSETSRWNKRTLNLCIAYTSRDEMASAVRATAQQCCDSSTSPASITTDSLTARMYTAGDPPVDILVRTSGVNRFSDFLLWQCHEDTDIQIVDTLWPDFGMRDLFFVILRWQRHIRRVDSSPPRNKFLSAFFIVVLLSVSFLLSRFCRHRFDNLFL